RGFDQLSEENSRQMLQERLRSLRQEQQYWKDLLELQAGNMPESLKIDLPDPIGLTDLKKNRPIVYNSIEDVLFAEGIDYTLDGMLVKVDKSFDKMGEFSVKAARNIQDSLGDGLY